MYGSICYIRMRPLRISFLGEYYRGLVLPTLASSQAKPDRQNWNLKWVGGLYPTAHLASRYQYPRTLLSLSRLSNSAGSPLRERDRQKRGILKLNLFFKQALEGFSLDIFFLPKRLRNFLEFFCFIRSKQFSMYSSVSLMRGKS